MGAGPGGRPQGGAIPRPGRRLALEKGAAALCRAPVALQGGCTLGLQAHVPAGPRPRLRPCAGGGAVGVRKRRPQGLGAGPGADSAATQRGSSWAGMSGSIPARTPLVSEGFLSDLLPLPAATPRLQEGLFPSFGIHWLLMPSKISEKNLGISKGTIHCLLTHLHCYFIGEKTFLTHQKKKKKVIKDNHCQQREGTGAEKPLN